MVRTAHHRSGNAWQPVRAAHVRQDGAWKRVVAGYKREGGQWRAYYEDIPIRAQMHNTGSESDPWAGWRFGINETPNPPTEPDSMILTEGRGRLMGVVTELSSGDMQVAVVTGGVYPTYEWTQGELLQLSYERHNGAPADLLSNAVSDFQRIPIPGNVVWQWTLQTTTSTRPNWNIGSTYWHGVHFARP